MDKFNARVIIGTICFLLVTAGLRPYLLGTNMIEEGGASYVKEIIIYMLGMVSGYVINNTKD